MPRVRTWRALLVASVILLATLGGCLLLLGRWDATSTYVLGALALAAPLASRAMIRSATNVLGGNARAQMSTTPASPPPVVKAVPVGAPPMSEPLAPEAERVCGYCGSTAMRGWIGGRSGPVVGLCPVCGSPYHVEISSEGWDDHSSSSFKTRGAPQGPPVFSPSESWAGWQASRPYPAPESATKNRVGIGRILLGAFAIPLAPFALLALLLWWLTRPLVDTWTTTPPELTQERRNKTVGGVTSLSVYTAADAQRDSARATRLSMIIALTTIPLSILTGLCSTYIWTAWVAPLVVP